MTVFPSDVRSLKKGIIETSQNKGKAPYTILLLGENGVGKSSLVGFIANTLVGKGIDRYDFDVLDHTNEHDASSKQRQTKEAPTHKLESQNGIVVSASVFECGESADRFRRSVS